MSAAAHVVVIAADLRRVTVKVSPGTCLIDVLDEGCTKLRLSSDKYLLRHKQKQVNLSLPFRNAGLITGAKLELVPKPYPPEVIQVALQLPDQEAKLLPDAAAGRLVGKFRSDTTLWAILHKFEQSVNGDGPRNIILTTRGGINAGAAKGQPGGQTYFEMPVFNVMGRELASLPVLLKTLSELGFNSGSVLMRLSFRTSEIVMDEAVRQLSDQTRTENEQLEGEEEKGRQIQQPEPEPDQPGNSYTSKDTQDVPHEQPDQSPSAAQKDASSPPARPPTEDVYRPVAVFLAPTSSTPAAALRSAADDDFTPTIAHAQLHQARLQQSSRNKRLPSDKEIAEQAAADVARIAAVKSVVVRVRFPDNTSSEWRLGPDHSAAFLYDAIRHVMANRQQPFRLILPGGKTAIYDVDDSLIRSYGLSGRVLINLVWDDKVPSDARKQPFLQPEVAHRGQELQAPEPDAVVEPNAKSAAAPVTSSVAKDEGEKKGDSGGSKIPKWLKLSKK
ncbi:hypothetical protein L249_7285 [Ophiocordyceps polyrhachis-furcata BCC 54312]|uniref:TUG ubiquitin-like domain-containing protein n=1 Tax=Ophiocordyceps polyrhachis-furcata BCC 54312 TaxID=1330021 RepID=A0A367L9N3_9HYPO|nr:hypothetical protein L249_7285 [Ophiocordyceps polyrhachis-furcata BCC 54312]